MTVTEFVERPFAKALVDYAGRNERVVCVTNDLTKSVEADLFRETFPDRYFSLGMAEQNLAGVLSGLAREGLEPVYPSFSVFATRRPYEQILLNIAYPNLPVRLIGFLPGITTPGGVTHQANDDVALMRGMPNMTVLSLADATDVETLTGVLAEIDGPVFCRSPRGNVPRLFDDPLRFGHARRLSSGSDLTVISSGATTEHSIRACAAIGDAGISVSHLNVSTLKPFTDELVIETLANGAPVITAENHLRSGGLGTAVAELIADHGLGARLHRVGIRDTFTHGGRPEYLFAHYEIDDVAIVNAANELLGSSVQFESTVAGGPRRTTLAASVNEGL
ncbi:MAG: transketolase [Actinomycetota bacterium]|nr:transketolase [Actinomycetota bacterium]